MNPAIRLDLTTRTLEMVLDGSGTDVIATVCWYDLLSRDSQPTRGSTTITASNGTNDVTIVAAPNQNVTRNIDYISVYNGNSGTRKVTIQIDDGGTNRIQLIRTIQTLQTVRWTPYSESGW